MKRHSLNGAWSMGRIGDPAVLSATVPGSVYADLLASGKMDDPFWRDNELAALTLMENEYEYTKQFELASDFLAADELLLCFDGLDTLAEITLNGEHVASCDNMHRSWKFDVSRLVKEGENTLCVRFSSPTRFIREEQEKLFVDGSSDAMAGFPYLRKTHCMFGWDWGPRLPDMGIWRDAYLLAVEGARLDSVYVTQRHEDGAVTLSLAPEFDVVTGAREDYTVSATASATDGKTYAMTDGEIKIDDPALWWPRGYGEQPLYTVEVLLKKGGAVLDMWSRRIGLRTLTMSRAKDEWGEEFCHVVNGVKVFAMGADYIPEDNIGSRITPERTRRLLEDCVLANFNAIRVWGGGFYPHDFFYDLCDELGLLVWQDFMFACAMYETTDAFMENIAAEITDNVRRLRHHASLALWCGNNEMEWQVDNKDWKYTPSQYSGYIRMYEHLIPGLLKRYDPATFYWPASPSSGGGFDAPNDPNRGDVHYWEVWHGSKPFSDYRNYFFRYASEFGFQSFPSVKTIESFTLPEDRNIFSYVMEKHQRNNAANGKIMNYMGATFLYPNSFPILIYASQLLQAEAIKYGVEHWRRNRGRCMGAVYWQLNDCWPVASWSSLDYFGRWKALHYYAKRFFAPAMLSCEEESVMTQNTNPNAEAYPVEKSARLSVANETRVTFSGQVEWSLRDPAGKILRDGCETVAVPALSSLWLDKLDFADAPLYESYLWFSLLDDAGNEISRSSVLFCLPKHFRFQDPMLTARAEGDEIVVESKAYARAVEIDSPTSDFLLADNYFDMNPGVRRIKILRGKAEKIETRSVFDIR